MLYKITTIAAAMLMAGTAMAQTPPAKPMAKAPAAKSVPAKSVAAKPARAPVVRTAKSLDCSKQADAKGLHGKPRNSFMSGCKKA